MLIIAGVLLWVFSFSDMATAGIYTESAHGDNSEGVNRLGSDVGDCTHCHDTFEKSTCGLNGLMLFAQLENPDFCMECHTDTDSAQLDMPARPGNIKSVFTDKTYGHPTLAYADRHIRPEEGYPERGADSSFGLLNRHAECADCHNPHTVGAVNPDSPTVHPTTSVARTSDSGKIADTIFGSKALQGAWGVTPSSWPGTWEQPTEWTVMKPPDYPDGAVQEYQVCFKCHSAYGAGPDAGDAWSLARDFNINNKSAHPVGLGLSNRAGSDTPKSLTAAKMRAPWTTNIGNQIMYCSDCH
jgi:cytochrome c553